MPLLWNFGDFALRWVIQTVPTVRMCDPSHQSHTENAMVLLSPADDFITHNFKSMDGSSDSDEHLVAAHVHASLT